MCTLIYYLWSEQPHGPPLIDNNIVFYSVVGGVVLLFLLPLVLWLRRRPNKTEPRP